MYIPQDEWDKCTAFHGHECPGLAIGFRAAMAARERLGITFSPDEELVCVTENDACGVDAIQFLTGCTMGKGNLIYRDRGKHAFSFFLRDKGKTLRIRLTRMFNRETMDRDAFQKEIMTLPDEEIFAFSEPSFDLPDQARIFQSVVCEQCGETAAEQKIRLHEGKKVCLDCAPDYSRGW